MLSNRIPAGAIVWSIFVFIDMEKHRHLERTCLNLSAVQCSFSLPVFLHHNTYLKLNTKEHTILDYLNVKCGSIE